MKLIACTLGFLSLVLLECFSMKIFLLKDDSKIEMGLPVSINGKKSGRQLRFFSTLSRDEIERRIAKSLSLGSSLHFSTGELYELSYKSHRDSFVQHPLERNNFILKPSKHQALKFFVNQNFHNIIEAKREENCALNTRTLFFNIRSDLSIKTIEFGLSEPFRMTLDHAEREGFKFELEVLFKDLDELFNLLTNLKNEGFEGNLPSQELDEIVVVGLDGHLKLVVPVVVGTRISDSIDEFDQFTTMMIEFFAKDARNFSVFHQK